MPESPPTASHVPYRTLTAMTVLGFSSGLPFPLVYSTLSSWLSDAKVPLATIGLMSELTLAYKFKFLWSPFLDSYDVPILGRVLGRRRGWIVLSQIMVALMLAGVACGDPANRLWWTIGFALTLGIAGATQDITIDGWRITVAPNDRQALMSSWAEAGYVVGRLMAGAGALILADRVGWTGAYLCMAVLMAPGVIAALLAPEPESDKRPKGPRPGFIETIVTPIRDLVARLGSLAVPILVMVAGFRMSGYVAEAMAIPLFKSLHYSNTDIGVVTKAVGFGVGLAGTFLASFIVPRLGIMASLLIGTVAGSASHLALAYLAAHGDHGGGEVWLFATTVGIEAFAYQFASIVLITYMSQISSNDHAASQYALLTSLCAFPGSILAALSGFVIEWLGFTNFFVATSLIGAPVAILAWWIWRQQERMSFTPATEGSHL